MTYLKEWQDFETIQKKVFEAFSVYEKRLVLDRNRDRKGIEYTYGLPYTSSGICAEIGNTNCQAWTSIKGKKAFFRCIRVTNDNKIVVILNYRDSDDDIPVVIGEL